MINIKVSKKDAISKIQSKLVEGNNIINFNNGNINTAAEAWKNSTMKILMEIFGDSYLVSRFENNTFYLENNFSQTSMKAEVIKAIREGIIFLEDITENILNTIYEDTNLNINKISKEVALLILRRILNNFYKHIEAMYINPVHGKGKISKESLNEIRIGNEYDVQRILYSIIVTVFPLARLEVSEDAGYSSVRYDIILDEYDAVIETKCTRESMSERVLTEELGSDIFHYKTKNLFFFIYDKEKIIKNVDAFVKAYTIKEDLNKNVETIVIHPIIL